MQGVLSKLVIACLLVSCLGVCSIRLQKSSTRHEAPSLAPPLSSLPNDLINILTLGHGRLYHDFVYIWLIQYLTPEKNGALEPPEVLFQRSHHAFKTLPPIEFMYLLSCYIQAFGFNRPQTCQKLLVTGIAAVPGSWKIPMALGYIHVFALNDRLTGGYYYMFAAQKEDAPAYLASLAQKLIAGDRVHMTDLKDNLRKIFAPTPQE